MNYSLINPIAVNSQDSIVQKTGAIILCKIRWKGNTMVNLIVKKDGREIKTFLNKSEIQSVKYGILQEKPSILIVKASVDIDLGFDFGGIGANAMIYPKKIRIICRSRYFKCRYWF